MHWEDSQQSDSFPYDFKIRLPLVLLIILYWLGQIWTTPYYTQSASGFTSYNRIIQSFDSLLQENMLVGGRFALYEAVLLCLGLYILLNYRGRGLEDKFSKHIYFISFAVVFISFVNPNNSFGLMKYYFTYEPRILLFYLFLLYVFLTIDKRYIGIIIYTFLKYGMIISISQALVASLLFLSGNGIIILNSASTLPNAEILNVLILFSSIALSVYFTTRIKSFLLITLLIHFVVFFSNRRTPVVVLFLTDLLILFYYSKFSILSLFKIIIAGCMIFLIYSLFIAKPHNSIEYYFLRIYSLFGSSYRGEYLSDMGHFEQTVKTFNSLFTGNPEFWGAGMRNDYFYVEGQTGYIHNNFIAVWALYGLQMTLFLFYILCVYLKNIIMLLKDSFMTNQFPVKSAVIFSMAMILIGDAFTGEYFCKHFCYASLFAFTLSILRLTTEDEYQIIALFEGRTSGEKLPDYSSREGVL